ncbi:MAG: DUF2608 domain-containing protein [Legionellales bacterium]|nr:DUF2608 domain-containing protein [Legionellales bacterium]
MKSSCHALCVFVLSSLLLFTTSSFAMAIKTSAADFKQVNNIIAKTLQQNPAANTLVAFDDDDTLLTTPQYLGGVAWFNWQSALLTSQPQSSQLVAQNFNDLLNVQTLLFTLSKMVPTDRGTDIAKSLATLAQQYPQLHLIVETSRGPNMQDVSEAQFMDNQFVDNQHHLLFQTTGLVDTNNQADIASEFPLCDQTTRSMSYHKGVFYTSGLDKGQALQCLFSKLNIVTPNVIIFVDDQQQNVDNVYNEYVNNPAVTAITVHYTKLNSSQQDFANDVDHVQEQTAQQWLTIKKTLQENLIKPNLP